MKDGGALREESLEGSNKNKNSRSKKMEKLGKNRDEVFTHFKKSCKSDKEAMEKTDAYMKELEEERGKEKGELKKSLDAGLEILRKSATALIDITTFITSKQAEVVTVDAAMKKSIATLHEKPEEFSGEQFLQQNTQAYVGVATTQNEILSQLAKSIAAGFEGIAKAMEVQSEIHASVLDAVEQASDANEAIRYIGRGMQKSRAGFTTSTSAIQPLNGGSVVTDEQLLKSINVIPVKEFLVNKQMALQQSNPALAQEYSSAYMLLDDRRNDGFEMMNKSIVAEIIAWAKPQLPAAQE